MELAVEDGKGVKLGRDGGGGPEGNGKLGPNAYARADLDGLVAPLDGKDAPQAHQVPVDNDLPALVGLCQLGEDALQAGVAIVGHGRARAALCGKALEHKGQS